MEDPHFLIPCVRNYSKFCMTPLFLQIYRFGIELGSSLDPWDLKFFFMKNFWNNNGNFDCSCVYVDTSMHIWESVSLHYLLLDSCNMWVVWYLVIWPYFTSSLNISQPLKSLWLAHGYFCTIWTCNPLLPSKGCWSILGRHVTFAPSCRLIFWDCAESSSVLLVFVTIITVLTLIVTKLVRIYFCEMI